MGVIFSTFSFYLSLSTSPPPPPRPVLKKRKQVFSLHQLLQSLCNSQLGSRHVGQVDDHQKILKVRVEHFLELGSIDLGDNADGVHQVATDSVVGGDGSCKDRV